MSQGHHQAPVILPPQERPRAQSPACTQEGHHLPAQPVPRPRQWLVPRGLALFSLHLDLDGSRSLDSTPGGGDSVFLSLFLPVSSKQISVLSFPTNAWKTLSLHHPAGTHPQVPAPPPRAWAFRATPGPRSTRQQRSLKSRVSGGPGGGEPGPLGLAWDAPTLCAGAAPSPRVWGALPLPAPNNPLH